MPSASKTAGSDWFREERMFRIVKKERLNPTVTRMVIEAPFVARKAQPGQFIIYRAFEDSERVPLTIAGGVCPRFRGTAGDSDAYRRAEKGLRGGRRRGLRHRVSRDEEAA